LKKIKTLKVKLATQDSEEEGFLSFLEQRDANGNVLLEEQYYLDGSLARRVERTFSESDIGKVTEEKFYSQEGAPDQTAVYTYNESGKVAIVKSTFSGGGIEVKKISYDEANNGETVLIGDDQGAIEAKEYRRYDGENRVVEEAIYEGENELTQKTETSFDDHGKPVARTITYGDGYVTELDYNYEMDDQGRVIGMTVKNEKGEEIYYEEYEYNEKNNISDHYVENAQSRKTSTKKYEYDDKDRVVKEQTLNIEDILEQEVHFQYDEESNQLKMKETNTAEGFSVEMYEYEYFE